MEETVSTITVGVITDLAKDGIKYVCEKLNDYRKEINAMDCKRQIFLRIF